MWNVGGFFQDQHPFTVVIFAKVKDRKRIKFCCSIIGSLSIISLINYLLKQNRTQGDLTLFQNRKPKPKRNRWHKPKPKRNRWHWSLAELVPGLSYLKVQYGRNRKPKQKRNRKLLVLPLNQNSIFGKESCLFFERNYLVR